jgi:protein phosphatase
VKKYLVIGDVHADFEPFQKAVTYAQENNLHLVSVGDLIDGGPDGAKVCKLMLELLACGEASCVKGNHEHKIIRYIDGANVILGPPNIVTTEQFEKEGGEIFKQDFEDIVRQYCEDFLQLSDTLFVTHAGMEPDFWRAIDQGDDFTKKMQNTMMFGQADYKKTFEHKGQLYPFRTYDWKDSVPAGITLFVGHDPAPLTGEPDFDNFQPEPLDHTNANGGRIIWLDCGAGKGGSLWGVVVNSDTGQNDSVEEFIEF